MLEYNSIKQVRICLEEITKVINEFEAEVIELFDLPHNSTSEIQDRAIGIRGAFQEEIHRSDDRIIYYLKEDRALAYLIIRRTEFNNAEITMITTQERQFKEHEKDNV